MIELFKDMERVKTKVFYIYIKRIIDVIISLAMLVPLLLLSIVIIIINLIKNDDGPLFYKQDRVGKDGKLFQIIKYRTMTPDAEDELKKLLEDDENKREWEEYHKFENDPRITPIGLFLRKSSIDEFPQFINVLKGDMSIIGPRPLVPGELQSHNGDPIYETIRPGITGWWACNGRSILTYKERLEYEYYYIKHVSFLLDLKIFFKTIVCVFDKTGAR